MFLGRWLEALCLHRPAGLSARNVRTHLLRIIRCVANMMRSLKGRFEGAGESMDGGTYGPETGIRDRLGSPGKVSAMMVTLYPPFSWIFTAVVRPTTPVRMECEGWGCFAIWMGSPAPMTTTLFGALGKAIIRDLRGGRRMELCLVLGVS